jgi:hypothetical protein
VLLLCLLFAANTSTAAPVKSGVAVTAVRPIHGVEPTLAQVLDEVLLARLKESGVFSSVIGGSDIASMVDMAQQKVVLGCDDANCLAELGGALGVPYLIDSSLSKVGGQFVLTLKILEVEDAKVAARKVVMVKDEAQLIASLEQIIPEVLSGLVPDKAPGPKAPAAAAPAAAPAVVTKANPVRGSAIALSVVGVGSLVGGFWLLEQVRTVHEEHKESPDYQLDENVKDQSRAQALIVGGLAVSTAGVVWAVW